MIKNKKVIIFDLDGTLIDSIGIWNAVDEELINMIRTVKYDDVDILKQREEMLKKFNNSKDVYLEYCGYLKDKYQSLMTKEEIKEQRTKIANKYLETVVDYKPYADELLKYLKAHNYLLALATTTNEGSLIAYNNYNKNIMRKAPINKTFDLIYYKDSVNCIKPDPEVHFKIMKELNVTCEECLIVEDSLIGVEAAKNANIEVINIYDKHSDISREVLNELSDYVFSDFKTLLDYIINELDNNE